MQGNEIQAEMPRYKCHKEVHALKILRVGRVESENPDQGVAGSIILHFEDDGFAPIVKSSDWAEKHPVEAGGYYVVYDSEYASWSPGDKFEAGYTLIA